MAVWKTHRGVAYCTAQMYLRLHTACVSAERAADSPSLIDNVIL